MRKIWKFFDNYSQLDGLDGKLDQLVHQVLFSGTIVKALGIVCISSHLFGFKTIHPLFCGIPYYVRKFLTNFENFSQPAQSVGKPDQPVH